MLVLIISNANELPCVLIFVLVMSPSSPLPFVSEVDYFPPSKGDSRLTALECCEPASLRMKVVVLVSSTFLT